MPAQSRRVARLVAVLLYVALPTAHALADDEARRAILDLRQQIRQMAEQSSQATQARIQLGDQIELLRNELAGLRGKLEQLDWQLQQAARSGAQTQAPVVRTDPIEAASFEAAMEQFRAGTYTEAAAGFSQFLSAYPTSTMAAEARFYHGSSLYAARQYPQAVAVLQALVQTNPADARAADALLIVAASQIELNALKEARITLQSIVQHYPQSQAAQTATERLKLLR